MSTDAFSPGAIHFGSRIWCVPNLGLEFLFLSRTRACQVSGCVFGCRKRLFLKRVGHPGYSPNNIKSVYIAACCSHSSWRYHATILAHRSSIYDSHTRLCQQIKNFPASAFHPGQWEPFADDNNRLNFIFLI